MVRTLGVVKLLQKPGEVLSEEVKESGMALILIVSQVFFSARAGALETAGLEVDGFQAA